MKKVFITLCCVMLLSSVAFAEDEGHYVVKNVKTPITTTHGEGWNTEMNEELVKIDTTTGRVWQWVDIRSEKGIKTEWVEMKDSNLQPWKK